MRQARISVLNLPRTAPPLLTELHNELQLLVTRHLSIRRFTFITSVPFNHTNLSTFDLVEGAINVTVNTLFLLTHLFPVQSRTGTKRRESPLSRKENRKREKEKLNENRN